MATQGASAKIVERLQKDAEMYRTEIEELQDKLRAATDEHEIQHMNRLLVEARRALASVLMKSEEYGDENRPLQ